MQPVPWWRQRRFHGHRAVLNQTAGLATALLLLLGIAQDAAVFMTSTTDATISVPQIDSFRGGSIVFRVALQATPELLGTATVEARARLIPAQRRVELSEHRVTAISLPAGGGGSADADENRIRLFRAAAESALPSSLSSLDLDLVLSLLPDEVFAGCPRALSGKDGGREDWLMQSFGVEVPVPVEAKCSVTWEGTPSFTPCEELQAERATNSDRLVMRVSPAAKAAADTAPTPPRHFCLTDGAWFESESPQSPWRVCLSVPHELTDTPTESDLAALGGVQIVSRDDKQVVFRYGGAFMRALDPANPTQLRSESLPHPLPGLEPWWPRDLTIRWTDSAPANTNQDVLFNDRYIGRDGEIWEVRGGHWWRHRPPSLWIDQGPARTTPSVVEGCDLARSRSEFEASLNHDDPIRWRLERERYRRAVSAERMRRWREHAAPHDR